MRRPEPPPKMRRHAAGTPSGLTQVGTSRQPSAVPSMSRHRRLRGGPQGTAGAKWEAAMAEHFCDTAHRADDRLGYRHPTPVLGPEAMAETPAAAALTAAVVMQPTPPRTRRSSLAAVSAATPPPSHVHPPPTHPPIATTPPMAGGLLHRTLSTTPVPMTPRRLSALSVSAGALVTRTPSRASQTASERRLQYAATVVSPRQKQQQRRAAALASFRQRLAAAAEGLRMAAARAVQRWWRVDLPVRRQRNFQNEARRYKALARKAALSRRARLRLSWRELCHMALRAVHSPRFWEAAVRIQATVRGHLARRRGWLAAMRAAACRTQAAVRSAERRHAAAVAIQRCFLGFAARSGQAWYARYLARRQAVPEGTVRLGVDLSTFRAVRRSHAARVIQHEVFFDRILYRSRIRPSIRQHFLDREQHAAVCIQRAWRSACRRQAQHILQWRRDNGLLFS